MRHAGMIPGFGVGVASGSILIASAMSRQDNLWTGPRRKVRFGAGEHPTDAPRHPTTAVLERSAATSRKTPPGGNRVCEGQVPAPHIRM